MAFDKLLPDYRHTELGTLPIDWQVVRLGELTLRVGSGITPTGGERVYTQTGRPFVRSQNVGWGRLQLDDLAYISEDVHATFIASEIRENDVLLNITGASIGRSAVADKRLDGGNVNQHVCEIRTNPHLIDPRYLNSYLLSDPGQKQIDSFQAGGNRQGLNYDQIRSFLIPLPPLPEQEAIAEALADVDALLAALDKLIAKKRAIKQAAMQQLLTGKTRLPGFTGEWRPTSMGLIGTIYGGLSGKTKDDFGKGTARYVTFLNVLNNVVIDPKQFDHVFIDSTESQNGVRKGDLLFNGTSETAEELAMAATVDEDFESLYLNSFCFGFRINNPKQNNPLFWAYHFRGPVGRQLMYALAQGATRYNMSKGQFLSLNIELPTYQEQSAIATVLSDMDTEITALDKRRDKTQQIKQGMMQQLLTGRIRLVNPSTTEATA